MVLPLIALGGGFPDILPPELKGAEVLAADSGYDRLWERGIRPLAVVGDLDSIRLRPWEEEVPCLPAPRDKDESDAELAFLYARELGWKAWQVVGGSGQRLDHLLALLALVPHYPEWKEWWLQEDHVCFLHAGQALTIPARVGQRVSILPVGFIEPVARAVGLRWSIDSLDWKRRVSLSNETVGDVFHVYCDRGHLAIIRSLEVGVEFRVRSAD